MDTIMESRGAGNSAAEMPTTNMKGGEDMAEHKGYDGRIRNTGAQFVDAANKHPKPKDNSTIHTGKDLRANAGKTAHKDKG